MILHFLQFAELQVSFMNKYPCLAGHACLTRDAGQGVLLFYAETPLQEQFCMSGNKMSNDQYVSRRIIYAMLEKENIERTDTPLTATSLSAQLRDYGLAEGQTVLVHMAMCCSSVWSIGTILLCITLSFVQIIRANATNAPAALCWSMASANG